MKVMELFKAKSDERINSLIKEFEHAPWDYSVYSPLSLDEDEAVITIYLKVGKTSKRYDIVLQYDCATQTVTELERGSPGVQSLRR